MKIWQWLRNLDWSIEDPPLPSPEPAPKDRGPMTTGDKVMLAFLIAFFIAQMWAMLWFAGLWMRADAAARGPDGVINSGDEGAFYDPDE